MINDESRRRFLARAASATAGLPIGIAALNAAEAGGKTKAVNDIQLKRTGRSILIHLALSGNAGAVEVRLVSNANNYIFEYDDISPHAPKVDNEQTRGVWTLEYDEKAKARRRSNREQRFPVVDIAFNEVWKLSLKSI